MIIMKRQNLYLHFLFNLLLIWKYTTCRDDDLQMYSFQNDDDDDNNDNDELPKQNNFLVAFNEFWPSKYVNKYLGVISSIKATDESASNVFVLHRDDRVWDTDTFDRQNNYRLNKSDPIQNGVLVQIFDGEIKRTYLPTKFYLPHGLTIDPNGNFWITDVALHQVFKFPPDLSNEPLLVLGERFKPGSGMNQFCKPTDVVVATNGQIFISDGYCNSRIMKFNENGELMKSWGQKTNDSKSPGPYDLNIPHQLSLLEEEDAICVADRENKRVVCYTAGLYSQTLKNTGEYLFEYNQPNMRPVYGVAIEPSQKLIFALIGSKSIEEDNSKVEIIDFYTQKLIGEIKNKWGIGFGNVHSIATCPHAKSTTCILFCNTNLPSRLYKSLTSNKSLGIRKISTHQEDLIPEQFNRRLWLYYLQFNAYDN
ncbi:Peptidyl-alpha-hydroxyglycine alpha-amidating lyase 2 [Schistosoma japonicum]|uniref:peptidylamidoglycolate lyase n=1 Tax=Schistosoma japonicum TaxID=6182 RepID=A0A4Z2DHV6_SCHJA|nr:Peptidyl-alpha-hydroxyglycine alpha-amidating lyase 2 [Schistosoma japonicum]